jgi:hypothetical protein
MSLIDDDLAGNKRGIRPRNGTVLVAGDLDMTVVAATKTRKAHDRLFGKLHSWKVVFSVGCAVKVT